MTKKNMISFFTFLILLTFFSCRKSEGVSTANYCQANINGKRWQAGSSIPFTNYLSSNLSNSRKSLTISGSNDALKSIFICIYDSTSVKNKAYILNNDFKLCAGQYQDYNISYHYSYNTDSIYTGVVNLNIDSIQVNTSNITSYIYRVHGTFYFRGKYDLNNDTVNVSNGAFSSSCVVD